MADTKKGNYSLDTLRRQIDEIDDQVHDLLMRRIDVARKIGTRKNHEQNTAYRPAREAQILRRLAARHSEPFPFRTVVKIWREIISASLAAEENFVVSVYVPEPLVAGLAYVALARTYFGTDTLILQAQTEAGVLRAVRDGKASVGVLPITSDTQTERASAEPWWYTLTASGSERPHIVAVMPWLNDGNAGANATRAMVVARLQPEASGEDISVIAFESTEDISRDRIRREAENVGLALDWAATWTEVDQARRWQLAEIDGFVSETDRRLGILINALDQEVTRFINLGCYAKPAKVAKS